MSFNGGKSFEDAERDTEEAIDDLFKAIPKSKALNYIGHLNEVLVNLKEFIRLAREGQKK